MRSQGSAYARFTRAERARATGNPRLAWIAATELRHVALEDALALLLVARTDARFQRGAAKWVARLTVEAFGVDLRRLQLAAAALRARARPAGARGTRRAVRGARARAGRSPRRALRDPLVTSRSAPGPDRVSRALARHDGCGEGANVRGAHYLREGKTPRPYDLRSMNQLAHLAHLALDDLPVAHRLALAAGAGVWLTAEEERSSIAHELVALAASALVRLRTPALLADAAPEPAVGYSELALESAGVLRLLVAALDGDRSTARQHQVHATERVLSRARLAVVLHRGQGFGNQRRSSASSRLIAIGPPDELPGALAALETPETGTASCPRRVRAGVLSARQRRGRCRAAEVAWRPPGLKRARLCAGGRSSGG
jgi:hypothetical protein